ncbi:major royal jelly protein [Pseudoduganella flava]|uniref:Major royal jelly protein n=2 Tax=Pseudoduganella flava TaxID=871742 RepID=A0A562PTB4_9BURK|nr:L-dopachrome tautomerase-related protein [Pseudoduganella flava]TWI47326.1 major royal jelly protein [Pseudoduganella flava]
MPSRLPFARHATSFALMAALAGHAGAQVAPVERGFTLEKVADFGHQVTGVTVAGDGRVFVNFPRWTEDSPISVAEVKDGAVVPFPNEEWNAWRNARKDELSPGEHWVCVQSVVADKQGNVWVLDPAAPAQATIVPGGPKLVRVSLASNAVLQNIRFDESVALQGSYLNDVRFSPDGKWAYITDSGVRGAIVLVDLGTGEAKRLLDGDPSTQPKKGLVVTADGKPLRRPDGKGIEFAADGIALSPDGQYLYWQAIKGDTLYRIATSVLIEEGWRGDDIGGKVETVGRNGVADGLLIDRAGKYMYVTSPEDDSVKVRNLALPGSEPRVVLRDPRLRWPDTFSQGPDGVVYVTTSRIQDSAFFKRDAPIALPTSLWRLQPKR